MRLNKFISDCGIASRRKADELILQGRITVNGKKITELGLQVDPETDDISFDGEPLKQEAKVYFILNKPKGYITSTSDENDRKTVVELINTNRTIFPVGRLDYNTTGVLLLTNDGDFANYLTHPSNNFSREYLAALDKPLEIEDKETLLKGVYIENKKGKFTKIEFVEKNNFKKVKVTSTEGRNHFVKKMFSAIGYSVKALHRLSFAGIKVNTLRPGEYVQIKYDDLMKMIEK